MAHLKYDEKGRRVGAKLCVVQWRSAASRCRCIRPRSPPATCCGRRSERLCHTATAASVAVDRGPDVSRLRRRSGRRGVPPWRDRRVPDRQLPFRRRTGPLAGRDPTGVAASAVVRKLDRSPIQPAVPDLAVFLRAFTIPAPSPSSPPFAAYRHPPISTGSRASAAGNRRSVRDGSSAMADRIRLPGCPQIGQQRQRIGIKQPNIVHIRHRQREPRPLQQMGAIAQFGKRRHPG